MDKASTALKIINRIAHESTSPSDVMASVAGLRRLCGGLMPSSMLHPDVENKIRELNDMVDELEGYIDHLENDRRNLLRQIEQNAPTPPSDRECYDYDEVMAIIRNKFGKQNGGLTLWADYNASLHAQDASVPRFTTSTLQAWRKAGTYPGWAVRQLIAMPASERETHKWSPEDVAHLQYLYEQDPLKTDAQLAAECSRAFGRTVNSNSIKSKLHVLRKERRIADRPRKTAS